MVSGETEIDFEGKLLVLIGDKEQITGAAKLSWHFVHALRQHTPRSSLTVLSLDEAVGWYWGAYPKKTFRSDSWWARLDRNVRFALRVIQEGVAKRSGFIFSLSIEFIPLCYMLNRFMRYRYAVYVHDLFTPISKSYFSKLIKKGLKNASRILVISRDTRIQVLECATIIQERIQLIPPPVDEYRFQIKKKSQTLMEKHGLDGYKVLLCVGRLAPMELEMKGYLAILRALPRIISRIPMVKLLVVGSGDGQKELYDLTVRLNIENHVVFAGFVPDEQMCDYYNLCDLFVLPSIKEGFGMVYTEALACGKPVIGGDQAGALDALLDGLLGLLVNPNNVQGLTEAIIRMLRGEVEPHLLDPVYLRTTVLAHYSFERFTERIGELLEIMYGDNGTMSRRPE